MTEKMKMNLPRMLEDMFKAKTIDQIFILDSNQIFGVQLELSSLRDAIATKWHIIYPKLK